MLKASVKPLQDQAKERYATNIAASFGMATFAIHIEAATLPGEDAKYVYGMTKMMITKARETIERIGH